MKVFVSGGGGVNLLECWRDKARVDFFWIPNEASLALMQHCCRDHVSDVRMEWR